MTEHSLVVKDNRLIDASYKLTLSENRIILYAIVEARKKGGLCADNFPGYLDVVATSYAEMFGLPAKQAYEQIKDAAKTLFNRYFVLYEPTPDGGRWATQVRWLYTAGYHDGMGKIRLRFSDDVMPLITELEARFTQYKLESVARMTSVHAMRLYELLVRWNSRGWREVEVGWLKKTLTVDQNYERLDNFKTWVIDVAVSQINEFSDLNVSYTQRKSGRTVTHFRFEFAPKAEAATAAADAPPSVVESPLLQRLRALGVGARLAAAWIKQDEARALASADYVEAKVKAGQVKGSAAGYLRTVFESGAELGPSTFETELKAKAREAAAAKKQEEAGKRQDEQAKAKAAERAKGSIAALSQEQRAAYAREWIDSGKSEGAVWDEKKGNFREAIHRLGFNVWLQNRLAA